MPDHEQIYQSEADQYERLISDECAGIWWRKF
jgi:hypothetical protein